MRSLASNWARGSLLALDAGSHLAPIIRILEHDFPAFSASAPEADKEEREATLLPSGPFAGLRLPHASARANALHIVRSHISTYLLTHPHLDHISGFVLATAALHASTAPKTVAALPSTIDALKRHIFNDVIWPNLSDEEGGVGFVTYRRLKEGGDVMLGEGEGRGYIEVCEGLGVRAFKVSHGSCVAPALPMRGSIAGLTDFQFPAERSQATGARLPSYSGSGTPHHHHHHASSSQLTPPAAASSACVVDSTAFFLRCASTSRELLFFGDVEPDSLSLLPRNRAVWAEAARKFSRGVLGAVLIECSYDDGQADAVLFGHLCPRHLVAELRVLAGLVGEIGVEAEAEAEGCSSSRKRSRLNGTTTTATAISTAGRDAKRSTRRRQQQQQHQHQQPPSSRAVSPLHCPAPSTPPSPGLDDRPLEVNGHDTPLSSSTNVTTVTTSPLSATVTIPLDDSTLLTLPPPLPPPLPLQGLKIIIIHVKDTMLDGPPAGERILAQLREHERVVGLGCEFLVARGGESYWV